MTNKELLISAMRELGLAKATALRSEAGNMSGTEIIDEEGFIPAWHNETDYTRAPVGAPVTDAGQVYKLLQPHNASYYPGYRPAALAALWRVCHTTNPNRAKPWAQPTSTSDMYLVGECMIWTDGQVYRCKRDTAYSPEQYAPDWEVAVGG